MTLIVDLVAAVSSARSVVPPTAVTKGQLAGNSGSKMALCVPYRQEVLAVCWRNTDTEQNRKSDLPLG